MATYNIGDTLPITWSSDDWLDADGNSINIKIELSRDNGSTWENISVSTSDDGSYDWVVTGPESTQAIIRLSDLTDPSINDTSNVFTIASTVIVAGEVSTILVRMNIGIGICMGVGM